MLTAKIHHRAGLCYFSPFVYGPHPLGCPSHLRPCHSLLRLPFYLLETRVPSLSLGCGNGDVVGGG